MTKTLCVQLVPLFQQLSYLQQEKIEKLVKRVTVKKGEMVLTPNDPEQLIILESGQLKVLCFTEEGSENLQFILETGDHTGENWLFGEKNTNTFLVANKDSRICRLNAGDFHQLLASLPELSYQLLITTIKHNQQLSEQNMYLSRGRVKKRLVAYFNDLILKQQSRIINLPFDHKDLAAYLGTTPETVSRQIAKLIAEKKLIKINNTKYVVNP